MGVKILANKQQYLSAFDAIVVVLSVVTVIEVPLSIASGGYLFRSIWSDLLISSIFLLHFYLKKRTMTSMSKAALIGSFPFEFLIALTPLRFLSSIRIIRALRVLECLDILQWSKFRSRIFKAASIACGLSLVAHWVACLWMLVHPYDSGTFADNYLKSLYWAVTTLTTVGYGDITPTGTFDRIFAMGTMMTGVGVFGVVIGQFSSLIIQADRHKQEKTQRLNSLMDFLERYEVSHTLGVQVIQFYRHYVEKNIAEHDGKILGDLPDALQKELKLFMKIKFIKKLTLFRDLPHDCLKMIASKLTQEFFSPNETIFKAGDDAVEMYIISHGEVDISRSGKPITSLREGQVFGEIALLEETKRTADVMSITYTDLYRLQRDDYFAIAKEYAVLKERMESIYHRRQEANHER
jgi:voltage-gated potassium channel